MYGEGYGKGIQKGHNYIPDAVDFILFDVLVGEENPIWLSRESIEKVAESFKIKVVPLIDYMTIPEAIAFVDKGFHSTIAANKSYEAEGLVLKTPLGLLNRKGERMITKIKTVDFRKYNLNQDK